MGGKKKTKQDEINLLQRQYEELEKRLEDSNARKAELAEQKYKIEGQLQAMKEKYEVIFEKLAVQRLEYESCTAAFSHWYKVATDMQKEIVRRGARRAAHDPEFAIIRELIHANGKLDHEQITELAKTHRDADIRRLSDVAGEFSLRFKFDMVPKPRDLRDAVGDIAKEMTARVYAYQSKDKKWKATMEVKDIFASAMGNIDGDQKD